MKPRLIYFSIFPLLFILSCKKESILNSTDGNNTSPNIVFIIADDIGWDAFGRYPNINSTKANTPTLDSLANNGKIGRAHV